MSEKFNRDLAAKVLAGFEKLGFVPMPGGQQEPVAGASPATAALAANQPPPGAGPGGPGAAPQAGGMPPGGAPPQGGAGPVPPELLQMINDPMVAQMLQQAGVQVDPASGTAIDTQTGQQIPPQELMMAIQQMMGQMQGQGGMPPGGAPEEGGGEAAPAEGGEGETADPHLDMLIEMRDLLVEIRDNLKMQRKKDASSSGGGGESKPKQTEEKQEGPDMGAVVMELQRTNDMLQGLMGSPGGM